MFKTLYHPEAYSRMVSLLDANKIVSVYRNLHNNCWSVMQSSRVICHCDYIVLYDAKYHVRQAGRLKVLEQKQKNVHAFVKGKIVSKPASIKTNTCAGVTYNPYIYDSFVYIRDFEKIASSLYADMLIKGDFWSVLALN